MNAPSTYIFAIKLTLGASDEDASRHSERMHKIIKRIYARGPAWAPAAGFVVLRSAIDLDNLVDELRTHLWEDDFLFAAECADLKAIASVGHIWDEDGFAAVIPGPKESDE